MHILSNHQALKEHRYSFISNLHAILKTFTMIKATSLFFSVLRPLAGRFRTTKVAKQTKENLLKKVFL
jgi:hypothetical protein